MSHCGPPPCVIPAERVYLSPGEELPPGLRATVNSLLHRVSELEKCLGREAAVLEAAKKMGYPADTRAYLPDSDRYAQGWHDGHMRGLEYAADEALNFLKSMYPATAQSVHKRILKLKEKHGGQPR